MHGVIRMAFPPALFYYNIKRLRRKASAVPASVPKVVEKQEVVPVHYNELSETKVLNPNNTPDSIVSAT